MNTAVEVVIADDASVFDDRVCVEGRDADWRVGRQLGGARVLDCINATSVDGRAASSNKAIAMPRNIAGFASTIIFGSPAKPTRSTTSPQHRYGVPVTFDGLALPNVRARLART